MNEEIQKSVCAEKGYFIIKKKIAVCLKEHNIFNILPYWTFTLQIGLSMYCSSVWVTDSSDRQHAGN